MNKEKENHANFAVVCQIAKVMAMVNGKMEKALNLHTYVQEKTVYIVSLGLVLSGGFKYPLEKGILESILCGKRGTTICF